MRALSWIAGFALSGAAIVGCNDNGRTSPEDLSGSGATPEGVRFLPVTPGSNSSPAASDFEPLQGANAYFGRLGGAAYHIEMPSKWNGELLVWAHGVLGFGPVVTVENPPPVLRQALIEQGFAWAASSFSENGYVPGIGVNDTLALKQKFVQQFGAPGRTYIAGASMGGQVVVLSLENFPDQYDGGLALCGAVAGEEELDYLLSWARAAEFFAGASFPSSSKEAAEAALNDSILPSLGPVEAPSTAGAAFASVIRNLTGGQRPFFAEGFRNSYPFNFGLATGDAERILPISRAATNVDVVYRVDAGLGFDDAAINRSIRRFAADPSLRDPATHADTASTTGRLSDPLLALHETGDLTVPISAEQSYRKSVEAAGSGSLLVQRIIRSGTHCQFSGEELAQAWNDLSLWVRHGLRPSGDDVLGSLVDAGRAFTRPLRENDPGNR